MNVTGPSGKLKGDITRQSDFPWDGKDVVVNFQNGATMEGNIKQGMGGRNDFSANKVTFDGATNATDVVFAGNIYSGGTGAAHSVDKNNGNHVTFTKGSMKGNIEADGNWDPRWGYNKVTFKQEGAKLEGNITSNIRGENDVIFEQGGTYVGP